jgi:hypothetical protein
LAPTNVSAFSIRPAVPVVAPVHVNPGARAHAPRHDFHPGGVSSWWPQHKLQSVCSIVNGIVVCG